MDTNQPDKPQRAARRGTAKAPEGLPRKSVAIDGLTHNALEKTTKKLGMSNAKYAAAAVNYFIENGLNPTEDRTHGAGALGSKVADSELAVRKQNAEIGNRLVAIMRTWEKQLYLFLNAQQGSVLNYLEQIEHNLLAHQVAVEAQLLTPMLQIVMRGAADALIGRGIAEQVLSKLPGKVPDSWYAMTKENTLERDQQLVKQMRELLAAHSIPAPVATQKPALAAVPVAPPKPATPPKE